MSGPYAAPNGPPPAGHGAPVRRTSMDDGIPDDPPPAYTPAAGPQGDTALQSGPARMDFSGPPPLPDRLASGGQQQHNGWQQVYAVPTHHTQQQQQQQAMEAQITGVGVGFGRRQHGYGEEVYQSPTGPPPPKLSPRNGSTNGAAGGSGSGDPFSDAGATAGPSRPAPPQDVSPTEVPTPGRPLLHKGQLLVYPRGHNCQKCGNTGYKNADPSNPCSGDWRKYGKPYNAALAASYNTTSGPLSNPSLSASSNFQRPLPNLRPPQHAYGGGSGGGGWNHYPGQNPHAFRPPPPHGMAGGGPPMPHLPPPPHSGPIFVQQTPGPVPHGAIVVSPGDPRIGGRPCWRCGGQGREVSFFGFDDGRCWECRGLGRVFP